MKLAARGAFWILAYLGAAVAPLVLALPGPEPGRGFLVDFSVALGFVGLSLVGLQFVLVARFRAVAAPFGIDLLLQYHRQMAYVALLFVLAHPLILLAMDAGAYLTLLDLTSAPWRARMAVLSTVALLALVVLAVWRKKLGLGYELWQITHGVLAIVVVAAALLHAFLVGCRGLHLGGRLPGARHHRLPRWPPRRVHRGGARPRPRRRDTADERLADPGRPRGRPTHLPVSGQPQPGEHYLPGGEMEGLKSRLDLTVVHVLSGPERSWEGEKGRIDADVLRRHLPERPSPERLQYLICGPDAMMDAVETCLQQDLGVPSEKVHTERFGMI